MKHFFVLATSGQSPDWHGSILSLFMEFGIFLQARDMTGQEQQDEQRYSHVHSSPGVRLIIIRYFFATFVQDSQHYNDHSVTIPSAISC
jgi:hypothetical protein